MTMQIITADQRAEEVRGVKALVLGVSGIGKTSLLRTLDPARTLFLDVEAGDLAVSDVRVDTIRPQTWPELQNIAVWLAGPSRAVPADKPYSEAHYAAVCASLGSPTAMDKYETLFVDSISVASRICLKWCETQPEAYSEKTGKPDMRGAYGLLGREFVAWVTRLQHVRDKNVILLAILDQVKDDFGRLNWEIQIAGGVSGRQLPGIVDQIVTMAPIDFGDGTEVRALVTKTLNAYGFPAKDRSGRLAEIEEPHLGKLIAKASDQARQREVITTTISLPADATQPA